LPTPSNGTWLANPANTGWFKVTLTTYYNCSDIYDYNTQYAGYFYLNSAPSPANMLLSTTLKGGSQCSSKNINSNCITGNFATLMNLGISGSTYSTNNIEGYKVKIEEVLCSSGAPIGLPIYEDLNPQIPNNPNDPIAGFSLNGLNIGGTGYFVNKFDQCYKLTVEVSNPCSSSSDWTYFKITNSSNQFRLKSNESKLSLDDLPTEIKLYPNPSNLSHIYFDYGFESIGNMKYSILDYTGKLLFTKQIFLDEHNSAGTIKVNLDEYSSGIYFLQIKENENVTIKKFIKQ
jgi:hypothetical protein